MRRLQTPPSNFSETAKKIYKETYSEIKERVNTANVHLLYAYCISLSKYLDFISEATSDLIPGRDDEVKIDPRGREARSQLEMALKLAQHFEISPYYASRSKHEKKPEQKNTNPFKLRKLSQKEAKKVK